LSITTYSELKTAISEWSKRGDINTVVDDFIDLAEAEMWQHLRIRGMEAREASLSISGRNITLPTDYVAMRRLSYTHGGAVRDLNYAAPEALRVKSGSGLPGNFTVSDVIELDRSPDATYTWELLYYKSLTALSNSNTSNAVLARFPNVYLSGALWALAEWAQKPEDEIELAYQKFLRAIKSANDVDRRGRKGAAPQARSGRSTP
jgi:hypothetical protein